MNTPVQTQVSPPAILKKVPITFTILIFLFFVGTIIAYGITTQYYQQVSTTVDSSNVVTKIPDNNKALAALSCLFMDTVFTLLGFGLLLSAFRNQKWTGLAIALFIVSFNIILGLLFQKMWFQIFFGFRKNLENSDIGQINAPTAYEFWDRQSMGGRPLPSHYSFRLSNLCSTAYLVGMTAFSGRVSINKLAISLPVFCFLYYLNFYLNALICYSVTNKSLSFQYLDAYGTILIYLFGGVYGIIVGAITKVPNQQSVRWVKSRVSLTLSLLGSLFLFGTFCLSYTSILTGTAGTPENFRYNSGALLIMFGLIGGILGNFSVSFILGKGVMNVESIIMGTISGGIINGGLVDVIQNIGAVLFIGYIGGVIAAIFMNLVFAKINQNGMIDSQGLLGPILVVSVVASFIIHPSILSQFYIRNSTLTLRGLGHSQTDFAFARYHLAYFALTIGLAAITGAILGGIYKAKTRSNHYEDSKFFADDYGLYNGVFNQNPIEYQIGQAFSSKNLVGQPNSSVDPSLMINSNQPMHKYDI